MGIFKQRLKVFPYVNNFKIEQLRVLENGLPSFIVLRWGNPSQTVTDFFMQPGSAEGQGFKLYLWLIDWLIDRLMCLILYRQYFSRLTASTFERKLNSHPTEFETFHFYTPKAEFCTSIWFFMYLFNCLYCAGFISYDRDVLETLIISSPV